MDNRTLSVIVPVYKPGKEFRKMIRNLAHQTVQAEEVILVHTLPENKEVREQEEVLLQKALTDLPGGRILQIEKSDFDHGGTRDLAARQTKTDLIMFMTQDAVPADRILIEKMKEAFQNDQVACAYARQLPNKDAGEIERYTRSFNYPETSRIKSEADLPELGIKTFFCSDVCAAYRRDVYEELGGFVHPTIFNEDMIFAGNAVMAGYSVCYQAEARVIHSHNYSGLEQFHRNFDLGVSQAQHPEVFQAVPSESEGIRMVKQTAAHLIQKGKGFMIPKLVWQSGWKFLGYRFGKAYKKLPRWMVEKCTTNPGYFDF